MSVAGVMIFEFLLLEVLIPQRDFEVCQGVLQLRTLTTKCASVARLVMMQLNFLSKRCGDFPSNRDNGALGEQTIRAIRDASIFS